MDDNYVRATQKKKKPHLSGLIFVVFGAAELMLKKENMFHDVIDMPIWIINTNMKL